MQTYNLSEIYAKGGMLAVRSRIEADGYHNNGLTMPRYTCSVKDIDIVELLVEFGEISLNRGLYGACESGLIELAKLLTEKGATDLNNSLIIACENGCIEIVKLMVAKGATGFNEGLYEAYKYGHIEIANFLIENGVTDFNKGFLGTLEFYRNILYLVGVGRELVPASEYDKFIQPYLDNFYDRKHFETIKLMIKKGATNFKTSLHLVCGTGYIDLIKLLIEYGATDFNWGLAEACCVGHIDVINLMIENGATDFNRGLRSACGGGRIDMVNLMIEKGANDFDGGLYKACEKGHNEIARLMIEKGADFNMGLIYAFHSARYEIVDLMVELGARDFHECPDYGDSKYSDRIKAERKLHNRRFVAGIRFIRRIMRRKHADRIIRHFINSFRFVKHVANYYRQPDGRLYVKYKQNFEAKF